MRRQSGFTLIELMVSIALMTIMSSAIYFAVNGSFESWNYSQEQLGLQKVLAETVDQVNAGTVKEFGLKDSLEIVSAGSSSVEFVPPWVDDTHSTSNRDFVYTLNAKAKSGSPLPIAEIRLPESNRWRVTPVQWATTENKEATQVRLSLSVPEGSDLRFTYHPDKALTPKAVRKIFWDVKGGDIYFEHGDDIENLSKNFFGVKITDMKIKYFTNHNDLVSDRDWVNESDLQNITAIEVEIEAKMGQQRQTLRRFVNLRNAPLRTGYLTLKKGMKLRIPDSEHIKTFLVTNISGISNNDVLAFEAVPQAGKTLRFRFEFEKIGAFKPVVRKVDVEYPPQKTVFSEYPRTPVDLGINLNLLGSDGLYDYDKDQDTDDMVLLQGNVDLYVTEMSIDGAGLFVRP